jgi:hypothetical protein
VRELCDITGTKSTNTMCGMLASLESKGAISRPGDGGTARNIVLADAPREPVALAVVRRPTPAPPLAPLAEVFGRLTTAGLWSIVRAVCEAHHAAPEEVLGANRYPRAALVRREIWARIHAVRYLVEGPPVFSASDIARLCNVSRSAVLAGLKQYAAEGGSVSPQLLSDVPREIAPPPIVTSGLTPSMPPAASPEPVWYVPPPSIVVAPPRLEDEPVLAVGVALCVQNEESAVDPPIRVRMGARCDKPGLCPKVAVVPLPRAPRAKAPRKASARPVTTRPAPVAAGARRGPGGDARARERRGCAPRAGRPGPSRDDDAGRAPVAGGQGRRRVALRRNPAHRGERPEEGGVSMPLAPLQSGLSVQATILASDGGNRGDPA